MSFKKKVFVNLLRLKNKYSYISNKSNNHDIMLMVMVDLSPRIHTMTSMRFPVTLTRWRSHHEEAIFRRTDNQGDQTARSGTKVDEICRQLGISNGTFYNWRSKYAGLEVNEAKRLRELELENNKLKKLLAEKLLENEAMKDGLTKKW